MDAFKHAGHLHDTGDSSPYLYVQLPWLPLASGYASTAYKRLGRLARELCELTFRLILNVNVPCSVLARQAGDGGPWPKVAQAAAISF